MPDDAAPPSFIPGDHRERFTRFFAWWTREKMLAKKFAALRLARGCERTLADLAEHPGPVLCVTNHIGWWDPIVMLFLHRRFLPGRNLAAPMDAAQLARFRFFRKLGTFGIDPDDPRSLALMADYLRDLFARETMPTLWINPQGRFADVREGLELRPGAAKIAAMDPRTRAVAVHIEYPFLVDPKPEIWLRFEPVSPERASTTGWQRAILSAMRTNAEELARLVIARDPDAMDDLVGGHASQGNPVYDLWLRLRGKGGAIDDRRDRAGPAAATEPTP